LLVYGLAWFGVFLGMGIVLSVITGLTGSATVMAAAMMPLALLMAAMFSTSIYFTFRDSFVATPPDDSTGSAEDAPDINPPRRCFMTQHHLQGRTEKEILWFAAGVTRSRPPRPGSPWAGCPPPWPSSAATSSNCGATPCSTATGCKTARPSRPATRSRPGPGSNLMFVIGNSAFQVRENSVMTVERGSTLNTVSVLRLLTGAVVSVWGKGSTAHHHAHADRRHPRHRRVHRGLPDQGNRSYFCNCYGTVDMESNGRPRPVAVRATTSPSGASGAGTAAC
jgi:hypothetical protein